MNGGESEGSSKYVTFNLDGETYALPINQVREVLEFSSVTKVPQMPPFVRGVINLRGNVLPVVDMRQKFGMGRTEKRPETRVIVIEVTVDDEPTLLGALADAVRDVIDLETSELKPPPKIGTRLRTDFIRGVGRKDDDFVLILDIEQVFSLEELTQFNEWDHAAQDAEPAAEAEGEPAAAAAAPAPESADAAPGSA